MPFPPSEARRHAPTRDGSPAPAAEGVAKTRLGLSGLLDILTVALGESLDDGRLLDAVITEAERRNGGPMADDLALLLVRHDPRSGA